MKKIGVCIWMIALILICTTTASANYIIEFDETGYTSNAAGTFDFTSGELDNIESASLSFIVKSHSGRCNSSCCWYYGSNVDFSGGSSSITGVSLPGDWTTVILDLDDATINNMIIDNELDFVITGQSTWWFSDNSSGGTTTSRFYLDNVTLDINQSAVPIPGPAYLLGSGVLGMLMIRRREI